MYNFRLGDWVLIYPNLGVYNLLRQLWLVENTHRTKYPKYNQKLNKIKRNQLSDLLTLQHVKHIKIHSPYSCREWGKFHTDQYYFINISTPSLGSNTKN